MLYKREISKIENSKYLEYIMASGLGTYINTSVVGKNSSSFHGLYIKQINSKNYIYLSKVIEKIEVNGNKYNICDIDTVQKEIGGVEFLESFNRYPVPTYTYYIEGCKIIKKYKFIANTNILCIEYSITNATKKVLKFKSFPCITDREILNEKRKTDMKYTSICKPTNIKVSLSITDNINIYLKTNNMTFEKKDSYITGVFSERKTKQSEKTIIEDLYVPGCFESNIKPGVTKTYAIYIMTEDINIESFNSRDIEYEYIEEEKRKICKINDAYHELKDLAINAYTFQHIDQVNKKFIICESMPEIKQNKDYIKNIITSLEGNYILLGRYKEAKKILEAMITKLNNENEKINKYDQCEINLLFIEVLNRYIQISECDIKDIKPFFKYIKDVIYKYINNNKDDEIYIDEDMFITIQEKRYIKINSLWYNALKIFIELSYKFNEDDKKIYQMSEALKENILTRFWDEGKNVLKYELEDISYPNFDMIYSQSLSYPIIHSSISMKIIDTAFKTLYTPLGMRMFAINTDKYDGYVYPHLMVHFIKANLRQMGVTRATQKIAFNLVKELLAEINKDTVGSVKFKYLEKNKQPFGQALSAITNAEMIRMYDMLT